MQSYNSEENHASLKSPGTATHRSPGRALLIRCTAVGGQVREMPAEGRGRSGHIPVLPRS